MNFVWLNSISAFEVEEAAQSRIRRTADEERGLRASSRTLSEVSCTDGVLVEIAREQVCTCLSIATGERMGVGGQT